ncbi:hypothetical protein O5264_29730, partial [Escherichia coli]|nr:hypothetical protein [Escherichia coli]
AHRAGAGVAAGKSVTSWVLISSKSVNSATRYFAKMYYALGSAGRGVSGPETDRLHPLAIFSARN